MGVRSHVRGRTQIEGVENKVLKKKRDKVAGGWRKQHNDELRNIGLIMLG
jgi:hypothetical protein